MNKPFYACLQKDSKEFFRSKRNLLFASTLLGLCVFVMLSTKLLPGLIGQLAEKAAQMIADPATLQDALNTLFPEDLKGNLGIFASDVVIFYGLVATLSCYNLVPAESRTGRWIFPLGVGYSPRTMVLSKALVYGIGAATPAIIFYNVYFALGSLLLVVNLSWDVALINSLVLGFVMFVTVYLTVALAAISKRPVSAAISILVTLVAAPDIFTLFAFGKYLPTHLITYLATASDKPGELLIPLAGTILVVICCSLPVTGKNIPVETNR